VHHHTSELWRLGADARARHSPNSQNLNQFLPEADMVLPFWPMLPFSPIGQGRGMCWPTGADTSIRQLPKQGSQPHGRVARRLKAAANVCAVPLGLWGGFYQSPFRNSGSDLSDPVAVPITTILGGSRPNISLKEGLHGADNSFHVLFQCAAFFGRCNPSESAHNDGHCDLFHERAYPSRQW
jgi:hypothetical protein